MSRLAAKCGLRKVTLDDEIAQHLDALAREHEARGMTPEAARLAARRDFGGTLRVHEDYRRQRRWHRVERCAFDIRLALRGLRRDWSFSLSAVVMLAVALALNASTFVVFQAMVLRGQAGVTEGDRVAYVSIRPPSGPWGAPYADFDVWRTQAQTFESMAFGMRMRIVFREKDGRASDHFATAVTPNAFRVLGVRPVLGRDFAPGDAHADAAPVAIINHQFWEERLGRRADIIGTVVQIDRVPTTVIGVMPEGFDFAYHEDIWRPLPQGLEPESRKVLGWAFGRLRQGATFEQARAELATINARLQAAEPQTDRRHVPLVQTFSEGHVGDETRTVYATLWAAAWLVLVIACANLTNLALARTVGRWRDYATRVALGASRAWLARLIVLENLALSTVAAVLAWGMTAWSVQRWADATASQYLVLDYALDAWSFGYLAAIAFGAAALSSAIPIARVVRLGVSGRLTDDARGVSQDRRGKRLAAVVVSGQMALAVVLLSGAGVLVRSLVNVVDAETGVPDTHTLLAGVVRLPPDGYGTAESRHAFFERLEARVQTMVGVDAASFASTFPGNGFGVPRDLEIEGVSLPANERPSVQFLTAGPGYFHAVGVPPLVGRRFEDGDRADSLPVAIVNERFAATFWPGARALGRRLRTLVEGHPGEWLTVVGVVPNVTQGDPLRQTFKPLVYVPFRQVPTVLANNRAGGGVRGANLLVRSRRSLDELASELRVAIQAIDPDALLEEFMPLRAHLMFNRDRMDLQHADLGKHAAVAPVLAFVALLLAAIGLYAVIAHAMSRRTREIGVRMAVGAAAGDIRRLVFRDGLAPVAMGWSAGLVASLFVNQLLRSQLVGVEPFDPVALVTASLVLSVVAAVACHVPSQRAVRVQPVIALRHD